MGVSKLMDERADAVAELEEINQALNAGGVTDEDADALAEFAKLEEMLAAEKLAGSSGVAQPQVDVVDPGPAAVATTSSAQESKVSEGQAHVSTPAEAAPA